MGPMRRKTKLIRDLALVQLLSRRFAVSPTRRFAK
jgi:hypothetical protein